MIPLLVRARIQLSVSGGVLTFGILFLLPQPFIQISTRNLTQSKFGHETTHPLLRPSSSLRLAFPLLHPVSCGMAKSMSVLHRPELDRTCYGLGARRLGPRRCFSYLCRLQHARPESACPFTSRMAQTAGHPPCPQHGQSRGLGLHPYGHLYR